MSEQKRTPSMQRVMDAKHRSAAYDEDQRCHHGRRWRNPGNGYFPQLRRCTRECGSGRRDCCLPAWRIYHLADDWLSWRTVGGDAGSGQYAGLLHRIYQSGHGIYHRLGQLAGRGDHDHNTDCSISYHYEKYHSIRPYFCMDPAVCGPSFRCEFLRGPANTAMYRSILPV